MYVPILSCQSIFGLFLASLGVAKSRPSSVESPGKRSLFLFFFAEPPLPHFPSLVPGRECRFEWYIKLFLSVHFAANLMSVH